MKVGRLFRLWLAKFLASLSNNSFLNTIALVSHFGAIGATTLYQRELYDDEAYQTVFLSRTSDNNERNDDGANNDCREAWLRPKR